MLMSRFDAVLSPFHKCMFGVGCGGGLLFRGGHTSSTLCIDSAWSRPWPGELPAAMRVLQITWGIQEFLETTLAHKVAAGANNLTAKQPLMLVGRPRSLCPPDIVYDMAVLDVAMHFPEPVNYSVPGH